MDEDRAIGWRDAWLPALLLALGTAELASLGTPGWGYAVALEAAGAALLVLRRRYPLVAVPLSAWVVMLLPLTGTAMNDAATPILFYVVGIFSLGRGVPGHRGLAGLAVLLALVFADYAFVDTRDHDWTDVMFVLSLAVPPFVFGRIVHRLDEQGRQLAAQQELLRDQAVAAERERIARELHDVIAHSLSAIVVQAAAAQDLIRSSPDRAEQMLAGVADTGRQALAETGRLLHLIRDEADELGLRPVPGLADLPPLVEQFRADGLEVETELALGGGLPAGVDVSGYRIVQELLTNALRYAEGPVRLTVGVEERRLRISCENATDPRRSTAGAGLGLQGIAERVALLGGTLERTDTGTRFAVEVEIPLVREVVP